MTDKFDDTKGGTLEQLAADKGWPWGDAVSIEDTNEVIENVATAVAQTVHVNVKMAAQHKDLPYGWYVFVGNNAAFNGLYKHLAFYLDAIDPADTKHFADAEALIDQIGKNLLTDVRRRLEQERMVRAIAEKATAEETGAVQ